MWCNWATMGFWGWTMMAGFWLLVIVLIIWTVRSATTAKAQGQSQGGNAFQILEERLARGEIDADEYKEQRAILENRR
jgi:putative membrane protein